MTQNSLTQKILKELLHYNPDTGIFTRIKTTSSRGKKGCIVGTYNEHGYLLLGDYILNKGSREA